MKRLLIIACLLLPLALPAQGLLQKGVAAEEKGLDSLARTYYRQAADTSREARLRLGLLLFRTQRFGEAARWLARADSSSAALAHLAAARCETSAWRSARKAAEKAVEITPESDSANLSLAMAALALCHSAQGNHTGALAWCRKAQQAAPASAYPLNAEGIVLFRQGKDNEALACFRRVLQANPTNVDAHFNMGSVYCYRNNPVSAITILKKGLQFERHSLKLLYCLGWAYSLKGEDAAAIQCLEEVLSVDSLYINAYNRLGDIYHNRGEYARAIDHYRRATRLAPDLSEAYRLMGRTYIAMGDYVRATRTLQKATTVNPDDAETYCRLAEVYALQKQPRRELANYKRAARLGHKQACEWCISHGVKY